MTAANGSELPPGQAGFRFLIELAAFACWGIVGWQIADGGERLVFAVAFPLIAAFVWGGLRAPEDHSANGASPIPVSGRVRLLLELGVLLGAAVMTALAWRPVVGVALGVAVIVHSATTLDRVRWLLAQRIPH